MRFYEQIDSILFFIKQELKLWHIAFHPLIQVYLCSRSSQVVFLFSPPDRGIYFVFFSPSVWHYQCVIITGCVQSQQADTLIQATYHFCPWQHKNTSSVWRIIIWPVVLWPGSVLLQPNTRCLHPWQCDFWTVKMTQFNNNVWLWVCSFYICCKLWINSQD